MRRYEGQSLLIVGLGLSGVSALRYLEREGAVLTVTDSRPAPAGIEALRHEFPQIEFHLGAFDAPVPLTQFALAVVSPGVSLEAPFVQSLIAANRLSSPNDLEVGQVIMLPPENVHRVEQGETLFSAALRFSVDTRSLAVMNGLERPWVVYPGDELLLPPGAKDGGKVRVAVRPAARARPAETAAERAARANQPRLAVNGPAVKDFIWPVEGKIIADYGAGASGLRNDGVNIEALRGAPIGAAAAGEVIYVDEEVEGLGLLVLVAHPGGWITAYAHAQEALVKTGQMVAQGEALARVGASGKVTTPQLHFQLRKDGDPVDPEPMMPG